MLSLATSATAAPITVHVRPKFEAIASVEGKFAAFKGWWRKTYPTLAAEARAFAAFVENEAVILEHNARGRGYTLGHNQFSDLTWDEFKNSYLGGFTSQNRTRTNYSYDFGSANSTGNATADPIDWVEKGGVTRVKSQGQCGSCWSFSTTGAMEGALFAATGKLVSLSEQELVSCDHGDNGCRGGLMDNAFDWIKANGISSEANYTYTSGATDQPGSCRDAAARKPVATCTGHADVPPNDEDALLAALRRGPVSVAIEADKQAFQLYKEGVLDNSACGNNLDHGVLLVGFGYEDAATPYWRVKNQWGASWGEDGFIRFAKGKNQCGISNSASQPTGTTWIDGRAAASAAATTPAAATAAIGTLMASPEPLAVRSGFYGDPFLSECQAGEANVTVATAGGVFGAGSSGEALGAVCAPQCGSRVFGRERCPPVRAGADAGAGASAGAWEGAAATATARCALRDEATGVMYCARICNPTAVIRDQRAADAACGADRQATCQAVSGTGVCVFSGQ